MYYENPFAEIFSVYNQIYFLVDFIIYFVVFTCLLREIFLKRYGHKWNINFLCYALGFIFSIYLILWEFDTGIYLFNYGPVLLVMVFIYLFIRFRLKLKERTEWLLSYFVFIFLAAFSFLIFERDMVLPGYEYLLLSAAGVSFVFIIYLIPHMHGKSRWKELF